MAFAHVADQTKTTIFVVLNDKLFQELTWKQLLRLQRLTNMYSTETGYSRRLRTRLSELSSEI